MEYKLIFLIFSALTIVGMKFVALRSADEKHSHLGFSFLFGTPLLTPNSLKRAKKFKRIKNGEIICDLFHAFFSLVIIHSIYIMSFNLVHELIPFKQYLLIFFVLPFTNFLGQSARALCLLTTEMPPKIHNSPWKAKSLSEFWNLRWNTWVRDWLHQMGKLIAPTHPKLRAPLIFFISGFFHECMVNLPYYISTGKSLFGTMIAYFMLQYIFIMIDGKILKKAPKQIRFSFIIFALMAPAPLFVNQAFLDFFGF